MGCSKAMTIPSSSIGQAETQLPQWRKTIFPVLFRSTSSGHPSVPSATSGAVKNVSNQGTGGTWRSRKTWLILWSLAAAPPGIYSGFVWGALVYKEWQSTREAPTADLTQLLIAIATAPVIAAATLGSACERAFPELRKQMIQYVSSAWGEAPTGAGNDADDRTPQRVISGVLLTLLTIYVLSMSPFMVIGGALSFLSLQTMIDPSVDE